jgi:hypothetical protein
MKASIRGETSGRREHHEGAAAKEPTCQVVLEAMSHVEDETIRPRRRLRRVVIGIVALLVVLVAAGGAWYLFGRESAHQVSAADALAQFRKSSGRSAPSAGRPTAGVYRAAVGGKESIGLPGFDEHYGPNAPIAVTHGDGGCFTYRADFNSHHWRSWTFCPTADATFGLTKQLSWTERKAPALNIESLTTYTCQRPLDLLWADAAAGDSRSGACQGTTDEDPAVTADAASAQVLDVGPMTVGRKTIDVVHLRTVDTFSDAQTGAERDEWWLDARTGLPVKIVIDVRLKGGPSDYSETATLSLSGLDAVS